MKNFFGITLLALSILTVSCQPGDPYFFTHVEFVNDSRHVVLVDFDSSSGIPDFILYPGKTFEHDLGESALVISRALVTFDAEVSILHEVDKTTDGLKNLCHQISPWWECKEEHNKRIGIISYHTYRFTDEDYEFAVSQKKAD